MNPLVVLVIALITGYVCYLIAEIIEPTKPHAKAIGIVAFFLVILSSLFGWL